MTTQTTTTTPTPSKPRIRILGPALYLVESKSRPGIGHQVDVERDQCGCPAGRHQKGCWHKRWAREYHAWRYRNLRGGQPAARPTGMAALQECFS